MKRYILDGASQSGIQWDGSEYVIQPQEIVLQITNRFLRDNLFRVESDCRVVKISESIIERYFTEVGD